MGSTQSINFNKNLSELTEEQFMKKITFIQSIKRPQIGCVQIYRFKQPPYEYLMKHRRVFQYDDPLVQSYKKNLQLITNSLHHKNIASIHYYKSNIQFQMCSKNCQIEFYCNYYTITLEEIVRKRRKDDIRFTANQIWYVLKSLLQIAVLVRANRYGFGNYRARSITLSSQGYIKLYILNSIHQFNYNSKQAKPRDQSYNQYIQAVFNRQKIHQNLPLPPQFLPSIKQGNLSFQFNYQKQDSFMIASVVLEMMIDEDIKKYYSLSPDEFCVFKSKSVWKDLSMLGYVYDKNYLIKILEGMLCEDPSKRLGIKEALQFITDNRENICIGGALRMFEDDQNHIKPKVSYRTSFDFESNNALKTIQPNILQYKLSACPIKTLSKKSNNKLLGVSLTSSKKSVQTKDKSLNKSRVLQNIQSRGSSLSTKVGNKQ